MDHCTFSSAVGGAQCEPFADMAKLGENCENATCYEGTCFRKEGQTNKYCKRLINPGTTGCDETHTECLQGNICIKNRCDIGYDRTVDVNVKVKKYRDRDVNILQWQREDMFYNLAPMLIVGFLIFLMGIMYCLIFLV